VVYREHKSWGGPEAELRVVNQQKRWRDWLNTYIDIWEGDREVILVGDFNIDMQRKETGSKARMQQDTASKILSKGWLQLMVEKTFKSKSSKVQGMDGGSTLDWILANKPDNVKQTKAEWTGTGADHAIVWAVKEMKESFRRKQMTRKRIWKKFSLKELEEEANKVDWEEVGELTSRSAIEEAVINLEKKIKVVMEKVAPMKTIEKKRKKSRWISQELKSLIERVKRIRLSYMKTGCAKKKEEWKAEKRQLGREVRQAKKSHTRKGIEDKHKCSKTLWQGVKDHLGWESTGAPTMLEVGEGLNKRSIQAPGEIAEEIKKAFEEKGRTVKRAIGPPRGNYLQQVHNLHAGNVGKFRIGPITVEDVRKRLKAVPNKPSYGEDEVSYTDLKLLAGWVVKPLARIFEASVKEGAFPQRWKTSRIKPLWKGEGNPKEKASSYRPVALLSATGRILEGIVAERMDKYAEERGIAHNKVHGFRKGRGVGTGMLSLWEDILEETGDGKKTVALAFIDVSAGFDSVPHVNLLRKLEAIGYDEGSLRWLSDYLTGREQYVVIEATDGEKYGMPVGTPQGGALGPSMWREFTNELPECIKGTPEFSLCNKKERPKPDLIETHEDSHPNPKSQMTKGEPKPPESQLRGWSLSSWVDTKAPQGEEEQYDRKLREEVRMEERQDDEYGPDRLNYAGGAKKGGNQCILYADDTTARVSGELWPELERKLERALNPLFNNLKENRVKVNEDKTGLMILGDRKARKRLMENGGDMAITLAGKKIAAEEKKRSLGLIISENMNWTDHVNETVRKCKFKIRSLKKLEGVVSEDQRKKLVEGVVMSRLHQHLEVTSMGRKVDLEALQRVQNQAMLWIGGEGKRAFRVTRSLDRLGWLDIGQTAAKATILSALKVIKSGSMQDLMDRIAKVDKKGVIRIKTVSEDELKKMNQWKRKSWSTRARRWLKKLPQEILEGNPSEKGTKRKVKEWVKENVRRKGADPILWGRWETEEEWEDCEENESEMENPKEGRKQESKVRRKPPTSGKQLRKLGEPNRKMGRIEGDPSRDVNIPQAVKSDPWPKPGEDGSAEKGRGQEVNGRKNARKRKEEYRKRAELRKKEKKEKAAEKEKKRKERIETMRKKGEGKTRNQPKISAWLRMGNGGKRGHPIGGKTGVG